MKKVLHHDIYIGGILMAFAAFFFILTGEFPKESSYFPRFFTCVLILISALIIWQGVQKTRRLWQGEGAESGDAPITGHELRQPMTGLIGIVAYIAAISLIGFFVSTGLFLLTYMWCLKIRSIPMLLISTLAVEVFIYVLFVMQLKLTMPAGILF